jgi:hypothetical protein
MLKAWTPVLIATIGLASLAACVLLWVFISTLADELMPMLASSLGQFVVSLETIFSGLAVLVAVTAACLARRSWRESTRPIVVALVRTVTAGNVSIAYNLVVTNTGTRPAVGVTLAPDREALEAAFGPGADHQRPMIERCFDASHSIPVLVNGESVANSFGLTTGDASTVWRYGSQIPLTVTYSDLDGRPYRSKVVLVIRDTSGFAGGHWEVKPGADHG